MSVHQALLLIRTVVSASGRLRFLTAPALSFPLMTKGVNSSAQHKVLLAHSPSTPTQLTAGSISSALMGSPGSRVVLLEKFLMLDQDPVRVLGVYHLYTLQEPPPFHCYKRGVPCRQGDPCTASFSNCYHLHLDFLWYKRHFDSTTFFRVFESILPHNLRCSHYKLLFSLEILVMPSIEVVNWFPLCIMSKGAPVITDSSIFPCFFHNFLIKLYPALPCQDSQDMTRCFPYVSVGPTLICWHYYQVTSLQHLLLRCIITISYLPLSIKKQEYLSALVNMGTISISWGILLHCLVITRKSWDFGFSEGIGDNSSIDEGGRSFPSRKKGVKNNRVKLF